MNVSNLSPDLILFLKSLHVEVNLLVWFQVLSLNLRFWFRWSWLRLSAGILHAMLILHCPHLGDDAEGELL